MTIAAKEATAIKLSRFFSFIGRFVSLVTWPHQKSRQKNILNAIPIDCAINTAMVEELISAFAAIVNKVIDEKLNAVVTRKL